MKRNLKHFIYIVLILSLICLIVIYRNNILLFGKNLYISFYRTIIEENRYMLMLEGLKSTIIISVVSIIIGTMIGLILFLLKRSKIKILKTIAKFIVSLLQGTPVTVLLLIFYYAIFGAVNINPIIVAIICFSVYFSAYVAEIYHGAYKSINKNQIYSAYALGFNKKQCLIYIILPQILAYVIPVYKNESVSLIKSTSIVGYISIMDLTKASDIIRNRIFEAFFPLILTSVIYFVICFIFCKILDYIYKKINPRSVKV